MVIFLRRFFKKIGFIGFMERYKILKLNLGKIGRDLCTLERLLLEKGTDAVNDIDFQVTEDRVNDNIGELDCNSLSRRDVELLRYIKRYKNIQKSISSCSVFSNERAFSLDGSFG